MLVAFSSSFMTLCISSSSNALSKLKPDGLYFFCFLDGGYCVFGVVFRSFYYFVSYYGLCLYVYCYLVFGVAFSPFFALFFDFFLSNRGLFGHWNVLFHQWPPRGP